MTRLALALLFASGCAVSAEPDYYDDTPVAVAPAPQPVQYSYDDSYGYGQPYDTTAVDADDVDPGAYQDFYSSLSPYGNWQYMPPYGYVWFPSSAVVGAGFEPYGTGGHFVYTDFGWTWVSDWDWGWAPFHYGRWITVGGSWCWIPGRHWGPAWVDWRYGNGYVGWRPLGPRGVAPPPAYYGGGRSTWRFTTAGELGAARPRYVPPAYVPSLVTQTRPIATVRTANVGGAPLRFNAGPAPRLVGRPIQPVPLQSIAPRALPRPSITAAAPRPLTTPTPSMARPFTAQPSLRPQPQAPMIRPQPLAPTVRPQMAAPNYRPQPQIYRPQPQAPTVRPQMAAPVYRPQPQMFRPQPMAPTVRPQMAAPTYRPQPQMFRPQPQAPVFRAPASRPVAPTVTRPTHRF